MSIKLISQVWEHSQHKGNELLLLLAIADFANDDGIAFPSVETLSKKARMSLRNTRYILNKLQKAGALVLDRNAGPKGCNLYRVQTLQGGANARMQGVQNSVSGGAMGCTQTVIEPSLEPSPPFSSAKATENGGALPTVKRQKVTPEVTLEFRQKMVEKYSAVNPALVAEQIDLALSHKNAKNYGNTELYVQNWLRRDFGDKAGRATPNGARRPDVPNFEENPNVYDGWNLSNAKS